MLKFYILFIVIINLYQEISVEKIPSEIEIKEHPCNLSNFSDAISAYDRATTSYCKNEISTLACQSIYFDEEKEKSKSNYKPLCSKKFPRIIEQPNNYTRMYRKDISKIFDELKSSYKLPHIVFIFTVNGRSIRQILRTFKIIYNEWHFYYFHVDEKSHYLRNELKKLEHLENVHLSNFSYPTIWGGASLLQMHLKVFQDLISKKERGQWNWDFVLNLSETDFPIKTVEELSIYLAKNMDKSFLKFRKIPLEKWYANSGIKNLFHQCENRMWKISKRELPIDLLIEGGSDWFCLNFEIINYIIKSNEPYMTRLKHFFTYTLLPSESFFHSAILNTPYCEKLIDNNLRYVKWQRDRGCQCQYWQVVDWCGCSPNIIIHDDWPTILKMSNKPVFFIRKVDPMHNSQLINNIDQSLFGLYSTNFRSLNTFWQNEYDPLSDLLEPKQHILFKYLLNYGFRSLKKRLEYGLQSEHFNMVKQVNSFFQSEVFKGYVINIILPIEYTLNNTVKNTIYEIFFRPIKKQFITKLFNIENSDAKLFQKSLVTFEISTDYDSKEQRFSKNYASVIFKEDNPIFRMHLDPISKPLNLTFMWINPENEIFKETKLLLNSTNTSQIIVNGIFKVPTKKTSKQIIRSKQTYNLNTTGIWKVNVNLNHNLAVFSKEFLVLPTKFYEYDSKKWSKLISHFWNFDSVCIDSEINKSNSDLWGKCKECEWSSLYPDPKSEIGTDINRNRISK